MKKIQRWMGGCQYCNGHGYRPEFDWCKSDDVQRLEESHAELLQALKLLLAECDHQAWIGNMPDDRVEFGIARAAMAKAEGAQP